MKRTTVDIREEENEGLSEKELQMKREDDYRSQIEDYRKMKQRAQEEKKKESHSEVLFNLLPGWSPKKNYVRFDQFFTSDFSRLTPQHSLKCQSAYLCTFGYEWAPVETLLGCGIKVSINNDQNVSEEYLPVKQLSPLCQVLTTLKKKEGLKHQGCSHSKLWLLSFQDRLRVVVGSANLTEDDFLSWTQVFWYQDFFSSATLIGGTQQKQGEEWDQDFLSTLKDYLQQTLPQDMDMKQFQNVIGIELDKYSFEGVTAVLVPSVRGVHPKSCSYGLGKVKQVMQKVGGSDSPQHLYYQSSSTGNYSEGWVKVFMTALNNPLPAQPAPCLNTHLIFPTHDYIHKEVPNGTDLCYSLFMTSQNLNPLLKHMLSQFSPNPKIGEEPFIAHSKVFVLTQSGQSIGDSSILYLGSHNFTPSAWGVYQANHHLRINNYELGVMLLPQKDSQPRKQNIVDSLPFKILAEPYQKDTKPFLRNFR